MKRSNIFALVAAVLLSIGFLQSHANEGTMKATNHKALNNFNRDYPAAVGAEWSTLGDKSLVCRFYLNDILYRAFYTPHGQWAGSVSGYDAGKLDKGVYEKVKSVYYNSTIEFVNQVDLTNGKTVYIVEVQDEKTIKKVRVDGDEMEILTELEKS